MSASSNHDCSSTPSVSLGGCSAVLCWGIKSETTTDDDDDSMEEMEQADEMDELRRGKM